MASSAEQIPSRSEILSIDRALVERVCSDDPAAIEALLTARCGPVIRYLAQQFRYEDLPNELYVHLKENDWRRLRTWSGRSSLPAWIKQVAIHLCLKHTDRWAMASLAELGEQIVDGARSRHLHEVRLRCLDLIKAISGLEPRERFLITQQLLHDRSITEIAAALGVTRENADVIRHRAVQHLRDRLAWKGGKP